jgi:hypothetical protein
MNALVAYTCRYQELPVWRWKALSSVIRSMSSRQNVPDAQQVFAAAITVLQGDKSSKRCTRAKTLLERRMPLRARTETAECRERRVLQDAAAALSKLWKQSL